MTKYFKLRLISTGSNFGYGEAGESMHPNPFILKEEPWLLNETRGGFPSHYSFTCPPGFETLFENLRVCDHGKVPSSSGFNGSAPKLLDEKVFYRIQRSGRRFKKSQEIIVGLILIFILTIVFYEYMPSKSRRNLVYSINGEAVQISPPLTVSVGKRRSTIFFFK